MPRRPENIFDVLSGALGFAAPRVIPFIANKRASEARAKQLDVENRRATQAQQFRQGQAEATAGFRSDTLEQRGLLAELTRGQQQAQFETREKRLGTPKLPATRQPGDLTDLQKILVKELLNERQFEQMDAEGNVIPQEELGVPFFDKIRGAVGLPTVGGQARGGVLPRLRIGAKQTRDPALDAELRRRGLIQ